MSSDNDNSAKGGNEKYLRGKVPLHRSSLAVSQTTSHLHQDTESWMSAGIMPDNYVPIDNRQIKRSAQQQHQEIQFFEDAVFGDGCSWLSQIE